MQTPALRNSTAHFEITGGQPLTGEIRISGGKNAVLPAMAAALLTSEPCVIENVPSIQDVRFMAAIVESLGATVEETGPETLVVHAATLSESGPPGSLVSNIRASFLTMGALLGRRGEAACSFPGGDVVGQRPIDAHLAGFAALGATVGVDGDRFTAQAAHLRGARIFMDYPSVLGTENVMLAACKAEGRTVIVNAAMEPEVVFLGDMLNRMGARVSGAGTHTIEIEGVRELHGCTIRVIPDRIEAGTYAIAAAITGGDLVLREARPRDMDALLAKLGEAGVTVQELEDGIRVSCSGPIKPIHVQALPYPGLATDMQAPIAALLTQADGISYIHERVFDNRLLYVDELRKMGAEIITVSGTTAVILRRTPLAGSAVRALDVRAGAALVLAALAARGRTSIHDIYHLDRGYAKLDEKLRGVGATIERC